MKLLDIIERFVSEQSRSMVLQHNSFYLDYISDTGDFEAIMNLNHPPVEDIYGMSAAILKHIAPLPAEILAKIFNRFLHEKIFPRELKVANIIPIYTYKKGCRKDPGSYRPIHNTCYLKSG